MRSLHAGLHSKPSLSRQAEKALLMDAGHGGSLASNSTSDDPSEGLHRVRLSDADDISTRFSTMKRSMLRGLMVIGHWEGALRNMSEDGAE